MMGPLESISLHLHLQFFYIYILSNQQWAREAVLQLIRFWLKALYKYCGFHTVMSSENHENNTLVYAIAVP